MRHLRSELRAAAKGLEEQKQRHLEFSLKELPGS